jgi:hypothetical protein
MIIYDLLIMLVFCMCKPSLAGRAKDNEGPILIRLLSFASNHCQARTGMTKDPWIMFLCKGLTDNVAL